MRISNFMIYNMLFTVLLTIYGLTINAQTAEDSVKQTIKTMFAAMKSANAKQLLTTFADSAILQTIARDKQGNVKIINEAVAEFADFVGKQTPGMADERITMGTVLVD